jgi:hypothetical protein
MCHNCYNLEHVFLFKRKKTWYTRTITSSIAATGNLTLYNPHVQVLVHQVLLNTNDYIRGMWHLVGDAQSARGER